MEQQSKQSKIRQGFYSNVTEEKTTLPNNLFLDGGVTQVNVIPVNDNKSKKIKIDPNELLIEFHCEV